MVELYVLALLRKANQVLLVRRVNASFGNGMYSLVGGKVEADESALKALRREVQEEVALDIPEAAFKFVHVINRKGTESDFVALCFEVDVATMQPSNNEPTKHDDVQFFPVDALPDNLLPAHRQVIESSIKHCVYSEHGW